MSREIYFFSNNFLFHAETNQEYPYNFLMRDKRLGHDFWQRVDELLAKKNLKQYQLAELAGMSRTAISAAKTSGSLPIVHNALAIANALDTTLDYLLYGTMKDFWDDIDLKDAFDDISLGKKTRQIAIILPSLTNKQLDVILANLDSWGYLAENGEIQS